MNTSLFFLVTVSLGGMAGMSGSHYLHTHEMVQRSETGSSSYILPAFMERGSNAVTQISELKQSADSLDKNVDKALHEANKGASNNDGPSSSDKYIASSENTHQPKLASVDPTIEREVKSRDRREEQLIELLKMMRADQKLLKEQLAETNGELDKANFRLDAQSDSFKPLRTVSERARSLDTTADDNEFNQLLPPK